MWFPTIPSDWTSTDQEIPVVLCSFLHANGSLRALISANVLTGAFLRWYLPKFWAWNHSNNKIKFKAKQKNLLLLLVHRCSTSFSGPIAETSVPLSDGEQSRPCATLSNFHSSQPLRQPPGGGHTASLDSEQLAKSVLQSSLTRRPLKQQRSVGWARASHRLHLQPNKSYVSLWMGTYLCLAPPPHLFFGGKGLV